MRAHKISKLFSKRNCSNLSKPWFYSSVISREIDASLITDALRSESHHVVCLDIARRQHNDMIRAYESLGVKVEILPSDGCADSVFIEDTAVIIDDVVLITNPGAISRKKETALVKSHILSNHSSLNVKNMNDNATLDGGDVLFTGKEIIVGETARTNCAGISRLAEVFPSYPVVAINMTSLSRSAGDDHEHRPLHLKSICSLCGPGHILVGGAFGRSLQAAIDAATKEKYNFTFVPDAAAANCVFVNGVILRRRDDEFPASSAILNAIGGPQIQLAASELGKVDGALTCCSLLIR